MSKQQIWSQIKQLYDQLKVPKTSRVPYRKSTLPRLKQELRTLESSEGQARQQLTFFTAGTKLEVVNKILEAQQFLPQQNNTYVKINDRQTRISDEFVVPRTWSKQDIYYRVHSSPAVPYNRYPEDDIDDGQILVQIYTIIRLGQRRIRIPQNYREGETNCLLTPLLQYFQNKQLEQMKPSTIRLYRSIVKKIKQLLIHYNDTGLSDADVQRVCDTLQIDITIFDILNEQLNHFMPAKKSNFSFSFINNKLDHVEQYFNITSNQKQQVLTTDEFSALIDKLDGEQYTFDITKGAVSRIQHNGVQYINQSVYDMNQMIKQFKRDNPMIYNRYTEKQMQYLSNFVHFNTTATFKKRKGELTHIDQETAYANFKATGQYYMKFPHISDIRKTPKDCLFAINNNGLYHCNVKCNGLKHIKMIYDFQPNETYWMTSPEIKYLTDQGVQIELISGAYGCQSFDLEFPQEMKDKQPYLGGQVRPFSIFTGQCLITELNQAKPKNIHCNQEGLLDYINECYDVARIAGTKNYQIYVPQQQKTIYKSAVSTGIFILAYQRINMLLQLQQMDCSKIYRLVTDAVYTYQKNPPIRETFRTKPVEDMYNSKQQTKYLVRRTPYQIQLPDYMERQQLEGHFGLGGGGKTHQQLTDGGLVNVTYVGHSNKLSANKRNEYQGHIKYTNYTRLLIDMYKNKYNPANIILDEISMFSAETVTAVAQRYPLSRIMVCGDPCQLRMGDKGDPFKDVPYQLIKEYNTAYRCKDPRLKELQDAVRQMRIQGCTEKEQFNVIEQCVRNASIQELPQLYTKDDLILVSTHEARHQMNKDLNSDVLKYRVNTKIKIDGKQYYNGDIIISDKPIDKKKVELTNCFTVHSVQGESFKGQIYIQEGNFEWARGYLYTAITRAEHLSQITIVKMPQPQLLVP